MQIFDTAALDRGLPYPQLIEALRQAFVEGATAPIRHHHTTSQTEESETALLLMPAWQAGRAIGVKIVTIHPENNAQSLPAIQGSYVLFDGSNGRPLAVLDGTRLTQLRTAAASALAAGYLARPDIDRMLMVGAGSLAPELIKAHRTVRRIEHVSIWNRTKARAHAVARALEQDGIDVDIVDDLEVAATRADLIACATMSSGPLIRGDWLKPGSHLDLVGAFKPSMREADDGAIALSQLFVDMREGALAEAGDIIQAIEAGVITPDHIQAELADLCRGDHPGRRSPDEVTVFKSVGTALEDLAAARLLMENRDSP